ncbi:hypothetical protein [Microbulbifer thermotolerans]|uniref:hypothetical protein n=1 Tax=Microbulbifer thermotolerans TaxID=252514 RepID=UPI002249676F|nr:hypothetical protein [Microbulbifer thermotolerans]MCX2833193.1 hypothetical protein [Microbulbifer thermotolerans]
MKKYFLILIILHSKLLFACGDEERSILESVELSFLSKSSRSQAAETGIWNKDKSIFVFCYSHEQSTCYVVFKEQNNVKPVEVSGVVQANLGKLGIQPIKYENIYSFPSGLRENENETIRLEFTTQVWVSGKKYALKEPLLIKNGNPVYR